ncbi:conjugal transfer protein TraN [Marinobacter goseongensis]|uniref:conjugal transfer protein TraN n=1 Tax=Marinobacter goseongensis TaxID=453838 RepID=UPI0020064B16|nr:conjugal transfer protein TraN [Marinobacter goseongensis]MCK7553317.1 conjugal transfer protein TraN [Marinobacter goseongensis]
MRRLLLTAVIGALVAAPVKSENFQDEAEAAAASVRNSMQGGENGISFGGMKIDQDTAGFGDLDAGDKQLVERLKSRAGSDSTAITRGLDPALGTGGTEMVQGKSYNSDIMNSMKEAKPRVESIDLSEYEDGGLISEGQLLQFGAESVFGGCREVTTTKTVITRKARTERRSCLRSSELVLKSCEVTRKLSMLSNKKTRYGYPFSYTNNSEPWKGDAQCLTILRQREEFEARGCKYDVYAFAPSSLTFINDGDGRETNVNKTFPIDYKTGKPIYESFGMPPGGFGNNLSSRIKVRSVECPAPGGSVSFGGITSFVQPENNCENQNFAGCNLASINCITEKDTPFGKQCVEEELVYECRVPGSQKTKDVTRTELICGTDDDIYCVDGSCFNQVEESNPDFGKAAAMLSAVQAIATHMECSDPEDPKTCRVFEGEELACRKGHNGFQALWDCCDIGSGENKIKSDDYIKSIVEAGANFSVAMFKDGVNTFFDAAKGIIQFLVPCNKDEMKLATTSTVDARVYLGRRCGAKAGSGPFKFCIRRDSHYCSWESPLGRIIMEQANPQFGRSFGGPGYGNCRGLTINEIQTLDWNGLDLSEWADMMLEAGAADAPGLSVDPAKVNENLLNPQRDPEPLPGFPIKKDPFKGQ